MALTYFELPVSFRLNSWKLIVRECLGHQCSVIAETLMKTLKWRLNLISFGRAATEFLKRFVRGMDEAQLKSFLRYVTGADVICVPCISVQFSTLDGFARRSIAHWHLWVWSGAPVHNDTSLELREEFNNILAKTKWQMTSCNRILLYFVRTSLLHARHT